MPDRSQPIYVLLVEDEELISMVVADELRERGFIVQEVSTAEEALRHLQSGAPVDVVFTDVNLPGDIDGAELAERARTMRPDLPILYASGRYAEFGLKGMVARSLFVPKPYSPSEVCTLIERLSARV
ncbi:MAG: response regulator [Proteobacteria bacterium]|nr:response regulator [Pseudomonadota bacterium]